MGTAIDILLGSRMCLDMMREYYHVHRYNSERDLEYMDPRHMGRGHVPFHVIPGKPRRTMQHLKSFGRSCFQELDVLDK